MTGQQSIVQLPSAPLAPPPQYTLAPVESLRPVALDTAFIKGSIETGIKTKIASRIQELTDKLVVATADQNETIRIQMQVELKQLRMIELQKRVRGEMLEFQLETHRSSSTAAIAAAASSKKRPPPKEIIKSLQSDSEKMRFKDFIGAILVHGKEFKDYHTNRLIKTKKISKRVTNYFAQQEKREQQQREREERERLRALKTNDESKYLKLLEQTKNQRLRELFDQTNEFLDKISHLIQKEKMTEPQEAAVEGEGGEGGSNEPLSPKAVVPSTGPATATTTVLVSKAHSYYSKAHSITEEVTEQPHLLEGGQLKPYQMQGLQWLVSLYNNKLNGILADEMGLGKTIQTISLVTYLMETKVNKGPYLIIVPLSTMANWGQEFAKWAPKVQKILYTGSKEARKVLFDTHIAPAKFNVVITTYEYIIKDKNALSKIKWVYMIVDEGHRMKNYSSKLSITLGSFYQSRYRLLLTGTPLQNSLPELWSLLNFLLPTIFDSVDDFEQWFNAPFAATGEKIEMNEEEQLLIIQRLHKVLRPFLLRRLKTEVETQLPDKVEKVIKCEMSAFQSKMYHLIRTKGVAKFTTGSGEDGNPKLAKGLRNTLVQLRKICNHPYLFYDEEYQVDDYMVRCAGKFDLLDKILPKFKAAGHRVLIFSQMTQLIDILESFFYYKGYKYLRLDGSTKSDERGPMLNLFNAENSEYFIFVLSTRAGGLGLNLQTADTVIIFDSDWNPQMDLQAQDRAHRIGQKQTVRVLRLVTANSVEERILARANFKKELDRKIIQAGQFNNKSNRSDRKKMLEYLMTQDETAEMERQGVPSDQQVNEMISRTPDELELFEKMDRERAEFDCKKWKEDGKKGEYSRLCTDAELPDWITKEVEVTDDMSFSLGSRARPKIDMDTFNMSEKDFLRMVESGELKSRRRTASTVALRSEYYDDVESSSGEEEEEDEEQEEYKGPKERSSSKRKEVDSEAEEVEAKTPKKKARTSSSGSASKDRSKKPSTTTTTTTSTPTTTPTRHGRGRPTGTVKKNSGISETESKYMDIFEALRLDLDEDGRKRCEIFMRLPSKRHYPDYYNIIKEPMDMKVIKERITGRKYNTPPEFAANVNTMFYNAQIYNCSGSEVFDDAVYLQNTFTKLFNESFPDHELPSPEPPLSPSQGIQLPATELKEVVPISELLNKSTFFFTTSKAFCISSTKISTFIVSSTQTKIRFSTTSLQDIIIIISNNTTTIITSS
eukprot:gene12845-15083_t